MKRNYLLFIGACLFMSLQVNAQYCVPSLSDACAPEEINNVTFAGIDNTTGCEPSGYNDFTNLVAEVDQGESYQISVDVIADVSFPQSWLYAFIDWNQDESWDTSTERYLLGENPMTSGTYTLWIDVPGDAAVGQTRMRIAMVYGLDDYNGCEDYFYGEVEDYTVNVSPLSVADNNIDGFDYFYSVQTKDLTISANSEFASITMFNLLGQQVINKDLTSNNEVISLSGLKEGVYLANVRSINGNISTFKVVKR